MLAKVTSKVTHIIQGQWYLCHSIGHTISYYSFLVTVNISFIAEIIDQNLNGSHDTTSHSQVTYHAYASPCHN